VSDTLPASLGGASWTCVGAGGGTCAASGSGNIADTVNLPVGASVTYTVNATVSDAATGTLGNTATVAPPGGVTCPNPGNMTPAAALGVSKTDGVVTVTPGGSVTYTIVASNAGPSNVTGATVSDARPPVFIGGGGTWLGA